MATPSSERELIRMRIRQAVLYTVFNDGKEDSRMEDSFASLNDLLDYDENVVTGNAADMVYV
jgi:hypothetical protein